MLAAIGVNYQSIRVDPLTDTVIVEMPADPATGQDAEEVDRADVIHFAPFHAIGKTAAAH